MSKITCFHDGQCPLCQIEINVMKNLDKTAQIRWIDITKDTDALAKAGLTYQQAMEKIHVMDTNAQLHLGVRGFLLVWERLPYYRYLAKVIKNVPFLLAIIEKFYAIFARYRLILTGRKYTNPTK